MKASKVGVQPPRTRRKHGVVRYASDQGARNNGQPRQPVCAVGQRRRPAPSPSAVGQGRNHGGGSRLVEGRADPGPEDQCLCSLAVDRARMDERGDDPHDENHRQTCRRSEHGTGA